MPVQGEIFADLDDGQPQETLVTGYFSCLACGYEFDPIATRWFCPHCKFKANCCEGEPLPPAQPPDPAS